MRTLLVVALVLAAVVTSAVAYGARRWTHGTRALRARLEAARLPAAPARVDFTELAGLPAPVERYFRTVLTDGQPVVAAVRVRHEGTFNMGQDRDQWRPFTSDQRVITRRPGFDWDARVRMAPGLPVRVHDAYIAGEGILTAAVLGLVTVVDLRGGGAIAEGELMRFLAESPWYPTALLPSQGVRWEPVDARSARASLTDGPVTLAMTFTFGDDGLVASVRADARGRTVGEAVVPTPWQGRVWDYAVRDGMKVPLSGDVAWLLPEGEKPYWRGRIVAVEYEFAR